MDTVRGHSPLAVALEDVARERRRQDEAYPNENLSDGTSRGEWRSMADHARETCNVFTDAGMLTWLHILQEEVFEAFAEEDPAELRKELIQVAAVAVAWVEDIDSRA